MDLTDFYIIWEILAESIRIGINTIFTVIINLAVHTLIKVVLANICILSFLHIIRHFFISKLTLFFYYKLHLFLDVTDLSLISLTIFLDGVLMLLIFEL